MHVSHKPNVVPTRTCSLTRPLGRCRALGWVGKDCMLRNPAESLSIQVFRNRSLVKIVGRYIANTLGSPVV